MGECFRAQVHHVRLLLHILVTTNKAGPVPRNSVAYMYCEHDVTRIIDIK